MDPPTQLLALPGCFCFGRGPGRSPALSLLGVCGFLTFGESVQQDVLLSYPSDDIPVAFARAFIILSVLTSYPILHFCGR